VLLVPDDTELRALVALRCFQQDYCAEAAFQELSGYASSVGVPELVMDDVLSRLAERFVTVHRPYALTNYVGVLKRALLAQEAEASRKPVGLAPRGLMTVPEAALECGVPRRTVYHLIKTGVLPVVERRPYRVAVDDLERVQRDVPGTVYRAVMKLRGCSYDAARNWVQRRRAKDLADDEIIIEAKGEVPPTR
jgi:hypothetical protein